MTTTEIVFNKKQDFQTVLDVLQKNFTDAKLHNISGELYCFTFTHKEQLIFSYFMKNNVSYGKNNVVEKYSSLSSDRPNDIKTEAFKIIASNFKCKLWENDCIENDFIEFN